MEEFTVPDLETVLVGKAQFVEGQGESAEALPLFTRALLITERVQGPERENGLIILRENIARNEAAIAESGEEIQDIASKPSIH